MASRINQYWYGGTFLAILFFLGSAAGQTPAQLETARLTQRDQRKEFTLTGDLPAFKFRFFDATGASKIDNAAALQLQVDKSANPFLSTLTPPGSAQFLTVLKPCGVIMPHLHPRATELYTILSGIMSIGVAQENGGLQNITFQASPGDVFIAPQGLIHFNANQQCAPLAFLQTFNSADPGAINIMGALASLGKASPQGQFAIAASGGGSIAASPQGAFALDQACLATCKLDATGAGAAAYTGLNSDIMSMLGLAPQPSGGK